MPELKTKNFITGNRFFLPIKLNFIKMHKMNPSPSLLYLLYKKKILSIFLSLNFFVPPFLSTSIEFSFSLKIKKKQKINHLSQLPIFYNFILSSSNAINNLRHPIQVYPIQKKKEKYYQGENSH